MPLQLTARKLLLVAVRIGLANVMSLAACCKCDYSWRRPMEGVEGKEWSRNLTQEVLGIFRRFIDENEHMPDSVIVTNAPFMDDDESPMTWGQFRVRFRRAFAFRPYLKLVAQNGKILLPSEQIPTKKVDPEVEKRRFYALQVQMADRYGYKRGWAAHRYREKYGVWPPEEFKLGI